VTALRPLLTRPDQHPNIRVTVRLQQPKTEWRAIAVKDHGRLRRDTGARQQTTQLGLPHGPVVPVAQVRVGIPQNRAWDVTLVVHSPSHIDFNQPNLQIIDTRRDPVDINDGPTPSNRHASD
jgi:hypothetical protein